VEYKLKELPETVYWLNTKQFDIEDENGVEYTIRIGESSKNIEHWIWKEGAGGWNEIDDQDLIDWIYDVFPEEEWELEEVERKKFEEKMDVLYDNYIKEKGEINSIEKFSEIISDMQWRPEVRDYKNDFNERFKAVYNYLLIKVK
jgi:hypothetical protein